MKDFLKELNEKYKYKTELHFHTSGVSGCSSVAPEIAVRQFAEADYSTLVITNHFDFGVINDDAELKDVIDLHEREFEIARSEGEKHGVTVIFASELRFPGDINDFLFYGPDADFYRTFEINKTRSLKDFVNNYKTENSLIYQAHPFRNGITLAPCGLLDGIEVYNLNIRHNSRVGVAARYAEEKHLLAICGSDYHHADDGQLCALLTENPIRTGDELVDVLRKKCVWKMGCSTLIM